jgi:N-acetylmuramoyl-L-alanine amidase
MARRGIARRAAGAFLTLAVAPLIAACAGRGVPPVPASAQSPPTPTVAPAPMAAGGPAPSTSSATLSATGTRVLPRRHAHPPPGRSSASASAARPRARPVVVLDPGHNGGNAAHPDVIGRTIYAGNGRTKPCNTVGAATAGGYQEHAFTFDVALRTRALLTRRGVTVLLTRSNDMGVGPCVDARARFGNAHASAAVVAIHADGAAPAGHGFHVIEAAWPAAGSRIAAAGRRLAVIVRARMRAESGLPYATYVAGGTGLDERADIAGLNLSTRPAILVECGNMRNPGDAALQTTATGRARIARAIAGGILDFLGIR